ncbi:MAG: helix-turn-helix domain-containing protein [Eubacterium sp.]|nr:helix-turn-helix domain-containing protein [Eubacterium sp.]
MTGVLIVDDDFLVRRYLSSLVNWEENGYELCGTAKDGREALKLIEACHPQILLTDNDMPVMNGIELLMALKDMENPPCTVILSCHDDFSYVRESMRLGAEEYLLKDEVTAERLLEVLQEISAEKQSPDENKNTGEQDSSDNLSDKADNLGIDEEKNRKQLLRLLEGSAVRNPLITPDAVVAVWLTEYEEKAAWFTTDQREQFYQSLVATCEEKAEGMERIFGVHVRGGWFAVLCEFPKGKSRQEQQYLLRENASVLAGEIDRHFEMRTRIGVCESYLYDGDMAACWERAKDLTGYAFYERSRIFYSWQNEPMGAVLPPQAEQFLQVIDEMRARRDRLAVQDACRSVLNAFEQNHTTEAAVAGWVRSADKALDIPLRPMPAHFSGMQEIVRSYPAACEERLQDAAEYSEAVTRVIRFIQQNYRSNISLNDAAEEVHLTTTYLSYVFHKETDITFSEYLQTCRIGHAKELLEQTDERVRDIGLLVGYNDNRHFSKMFKKATGLTPQDYRKRFGKR